MSKSSTYLDEVHARREGGALPLTCGRRLAAALALVALAAGGCSSSEPGDAPDAGQQTGSPDAGEQTGTPDAGDSGETCPPVELAVPNEGWPHVTEGSTVSYDHNPPASGVHYPVWAVWKVFSEPVPRGYWVHNVEHGGVVLLYHPDAPAALVDELIAAYDAIPDDAACGHKRAMLTPDPLLGDPIAVVAADVVLLGDCVDEAAILAFVDDHRGAGPENVCAHGTYDE
jgi:hypothetical protein